jgi:hypothetical protein
MRLYDDDDEDVGMSACCDPDFSRRNLFLPLVSSSIQNRFIPSASSPTPSE